MPVVISEFETVADAPQAGDAGTGTSASESGAPGLADPKDVTPVLRLLEERALRAWAH